MIRFVFNEMLVLSIKYKVLGSAASSLVPCPLFVFRFVFNEMYVLGIKYKVLGTVASSPVPCPSSPYTRNS